MSEGGEKQDGDVPNSKPQPVEVSDRGRARRSKVGDGFRSFDPASHFEGTDAILAQMRAETLSAGQKTPVDSDVSEQLPPTDRATYSAQGTVLQSFQTDEQAAAQVAAAKAMDQKAKEHPEKLSTPGTNSPLITTEQTVSALTAFRAAGAKLLKNRAANHPSTAENTSTTPTDATDTNNTKS